MRKIIYMGVICGGLLMSACDDFIDVQPVDVLDIEQVFETESDFFVALNGAYANMQSGGYYGEDIMIIADASSDNGIIPADAETSRTPHWYNLALSPVNSANGLWDTGYEVIAQANNVLTSLEGKSFSEAVTKRITGEAKFIRAITYFDLLRVFSADYNATPDHSNLGVPLVTRTEIGEPARETIGTVYQFILDELDEVITLLEENGRPVPIPQMSAASRDAAIALRARVYLYMGEYDLARTDANTIINEGNYELAPYIVLDGTNAIDLDAIDSWSDVAPTSEAIFEFEVDQTDSSFPGLAGLAGRYQKEAGNAVFGPNLDIVNLYAADDVRKNWYEQDNPLAIWHVDKYPGQGGDPLQFTVPVLRLTEMYLILAETSAQLGDDDTALSAINMIRARANQSDFDTSGDQLLADILEERRRELAFEGHRYFDLKRLGQDIVRNDCALEVNCVVPSGDRLFHYPIPQEEIDGNSNIVQEGY